MATISEEDWGVFIKNANVQKAMVVAPGTGNQIKGRFIKILADKLIEFWERHKNTLIPFLTNLAIAALDALASAQNDIGSVDPPGPA